MDFDISKVSGIGDYHTERATLGKGDDTEEVIIYRVPEENPTTSSAKPFLILRKNTLEVRTDAKLRDLLREKYESVMESRYFGKGGVEIVNSGQLSTDELNDLVRLSFNMSKEITA